METGWRLAQSAWGQGYASEAARASLRFGFETLRLPIIYAWAARANRPSHKVMERIGMVRDERADFEHPDMPEGSPFKRLWVWSIDRARWQDGSPSPEGKPSVA